MRAPLLHYACHLYRLHTALLPTTPTSRVPATALLLPSACHLRRATSIALVSLAPPRPHTLSPLQPRPTTLCVPPLSPSHSLTPYDSYLPRASHRPTPTVRVPPPSRHLHRSRTAIVSSTTPTTPTHALTPQPRPTHSLLTYFISLSLPSTTHYLTSTLSYPSVRRLEHQPHAAPLVYSHSSSNSPRPPGRRRRGRAATDR